MSNREQIERYVGYPLTPFYAVFGTPEGTTLDEETGSEKSEVAHRFGQYGNTEYKQKESAEFPPLGSSQIITNTKVASSCLVDMEADMSANP